MRLPRGSYQRGPSRRSEAGASAVEFALIAPLLFMLLFGIVGFGTVFAQKQALGNAARQAARFGVVANHTCAEITVQATEATNGTLAMDSDDVDVAVRRGRTAATSVLACATPTAVTRPCAGAADDESLFVTTTFDSTLVIPFAVVMDDFEVSGRGVFRCEFS